MKIAENFIAGRRVQSASSEYQSVWNPATGAQIGSTPVSTLAEVSKAVASSYAAADTWGDVPLAARQQILFSMRQSLIDHSSEIAELITLENGKTIEDSRMELRRGIEAVEFSCGLPHLLKGEYSQTASTGVDVHSVRQPLGVVACVTPFNFPVMVPLWMLANALACGNAVVLKPSEKTPSSTLRLVEVLSEAGIPSGALNLVQGNQRVAETLLTHPAISGVSFIGSTPAAKAVYETAAAHGKRVQALGGAKNHLVVLPDADMEATAKAVVASAFGAAGERCMAASVLVTVADAAEALLPLIADLVKEMKVGDGSIVGHDFGPLITQEHRTRVEEFIGSAEREGADVYVDGRSDEVCQGPGFFLGPSILDNVAPQMSVYKEEIFGPVLSVVHTQTMRQALDLVNAHDLGNGAVIFTESGGSAQEFELKCAAGMVGINVPIPTPAGWFSFGGWKSSLFGDSNMYGPDGVRFFTKQKVITTRWNSHALSA